MNSKTEDCCVYFSGTLNEVTPLEKIVDPLHQAQGKASDGMIHVDLSQIDYFNSVGIGLWMQAMKETDLVGYYINAPEWFVHQLNFLSALTNNGKMLVRSLEAPFYRTKDGDVAFIMLEVGKDIPIQSDYEDFDVSGLPFDQSQLEPDFYPDDYFRFILAHYENYLERLSPRKSA